MSLYDQATAATYARGTFGSPSGFGSRPGVLVVDFCRGMTDPASPVGADMSPALACTARLLDVARSSGSPIVFTTIVYAKGCLDGGAFVVKVPALRVFEDGGPWSEIDQGVKPLPGEPVVVKKFASAFYGTNVGSLFTSLGVDTVVIAGSTTSGCVRASAVDALQSGFRVIVPRECVADRAPGPHEANLFDLQAKYADVLLLDEVLRAISRLGRTAPSPEER